MGRHLYPAGWTLVRGDGDSDGSEWRHPRATSPVSATIAHGCLFVYSPNTPFEPTAPGDPHGYTRFRAYAILEHGGDLSAAARYQRLTIGAPMGLVRPAGDPYGYLQPDGLAGPYNGLQGAEIDRPAGPIPITINSNGEIERGRTSFEGRAGIEFSLSDNDNLGIGLRGGKRKGGFNDSQDFTEFSSTDPVEFNYTGKSERSREGTYYSLNSNYTRTFSNPGHQLLAELLFSKQSSEELTTTSEFDDVSQISGKKTTENGPSTDFRGKLDYTLPFSDVSKFEAGYQGEIELSDEMTELYEYNTLTNDYEIQSQYSNITEYNESQHSLYSMYSNMLWVLNYQLGLRAEYTYRNIEVPLISQTFNIDRIDYFPSVHTSYKITPVSTVMASYSRRINRPGGWALEPFPTWVDANNVRIGNPDLLPEFIDSNETGPQTILGSINISAELYYRMTTNKIEPVRTALEDNVTLTTFSNVGEDGGLPTSWPDALLQVGTLSNHEAGEERH